MQFICTGGSRTMHETRYRRWIYFKFRENVIDDRCTWNLYELSFPFWVNEQVLHHAEGSSGFLCLWPCFPVEGSDAFTCNTFHIFQGELGSCGFRNSLESSRDVCEMTAPKNMHVEAIHRSLLPRGSSETVASFNPINIPIMRWKYCKTCTTSSALGVSHFVSMCQVCGIEISQWIFPLIRCIKLSLSCIRDRVSLAFLWNQPWSWLVQHLINVFLLMLITKFQNWLERVGVDALGCTISASMNEKLSNRF